jgi:iron(III) transport system substrate-binding protein
MKKLVKLVTVVLLVAFLASCAQTTKAPEATTAATDAALSAKEQWLKDNQLGAYDTGTQDWAAIEAAAKKEGKLVVYANSSKIEAAAELFMQMYPEITVQAFDLGGDDVLLKTVEEQKAGAFTGDVWQSSGGANLIGEVIPNGYVYRFLPDTYVDLIPDEYTRPLVMFKLGTSVFAYNSELNETCPIKNIWELTEPQWKGKFFIEDPMNDASTLTKLLTIVSHDAEMTAAYKNYYGSDPVLDADTATVGWLWLKRFAANGPIPESGGDEVDSAYATPGMTDNYLALGSYSNYPDVLDGNLAFEPCWGLDPIVGIQSQSYLGILNQAPHPNAAKLWMKFILSPEGRDPWAKFGTYFTDSTYVVPEGQMSLTDMMAVSWLIDEQFGYDNLVTGRDFYLLNLGK